MKFEQKASENTRGASYSERAVRCPKAYDAKAMVGYGAKASPGDIVVWRTELNDGSFTQHIGRVLGRVDAYAIGEIAKVENHLAVIRFSDDLHHAHEVWVNPENVLTVSSPSPKLMAFLLQEKLPPIPEMLRLSMNGSLCESYIADRNRTQDT